MATISFRFILSPFLVVFQFFFIFRIFFFPAVYSLNYDCFTSTLLLTLVGNSLFGLTSWWKLPYALTYLRFCHSPLNLISLKKQSGLISYLGCNRLSHMCIYTFSSLAVSLSEQLVPQACTEHIRLMDIFLGTRYV